MPIPRLVVPPASPTTKPAVHTGQHGKPALLAVVQRLVERVGRIGDLLHGGSGSRHVVGVVAQARHRIVRLLLAGIVTRRNSSAHWRDRSEQQN